MKSAVIYTFISILLLLLFNCNAVYAGTGQIFSPSGLPASSTQSYTPPTPGNTPTVTFPTPPLPLGAEILQSFPGSSIPLGNGGTQKPPGSTTESSNAKQSAPSASETNSVGTFFQCSPAQPAKKKQSALKSPSKIIWHIFDNLGVPMFVGKDDDLDPSLRRAYVMPPAAPVKNTAPATPQKIPESELEGTDGTSKDDQTLPLH